MGKNYFYKNSKKSMFNKELNTFSNLLISNFLIYYILISNLLISKFLILIFLQPDNVDFEISNYELF